MLPAQGCKKCAYTEQDPFGATLLLCDTCDKPWHKFSKVIAVAYII